MAAGNAFVGQPRTLRRGEHPELGTLLLVLQNGRPDRVVVPGGRIWRGFRAPIIGNLQVVPLNEGSVDVQQTVRDVVTAGQEKFVVRSVPLELRVRLNPADDYVALRSFMTQRGTSYADDLLAELRNGVDELVRSVFAVTPHDALYGAPVAGILKPGSAPIPCAHGLMLIESLAIGGSIEWSETYLKIKEANDATLVGLATQRSDETLGTDRARVDATVLSARYREFAPLAAALNVPIDYFVNPEALAASRETATEIIAKLLEPGNRALLQRDPAMLGNLLQATGLTNLMNQLGPPSQITLDGASHATLQHEPAIGAAPARPASGPPTEPLSLGEPGDAMGLNLDRRLARLWSTAGPLDPQLIGLAADAEGDAATVIAVSARTAVAVPADFTARAAALLRVQHVTVISLVAASYAELAEAWLTQVLGQASHTVTAQIDITDAGGLDQLVISLDGDPRACHAMVQQLDKPGLTARGALEALLPFAGLMIELGD